MKNCIHCQKEFNPPHRDSLYCSQSCKYYAKKFRSTKKNLCLNCHNPTSNPKYCSSKCAAIVNNRLFTKIQKQLKPKFCRVCNIDLTGKRRKVCDNCLIPPDLTLGQATYTKHHRSAAFALVRYRARSLIIKLGWKRCCNCGYSKHVEAAHIKAIKEYSDDTLLSVINNINNLLPLCPNCHWELDHDLLKIEDIKNCPSAPETGFEPAFSVPLPVGN